jgi:hypothetical protein
MVSRCASRAAETESAEKAKEAKWYTAAATSRLHQVVLTADIDADRESLQRPDDVREVLMVSHFRRLSGGEYLHRTAS